MRRLVPVCLGLVVALSVPALAKPPPPGGGGDVLITDRTYVRHDGGTDAAIAACNNDAPDATAGGNRQANEPSVAINPSNPKVMVAGSNDYCQVPLTGDAWMGFYVSTNGGKTWVDSLNPGYPSDTSTEGQASPIFGRAAASGDPIQDWDNDNNLFYGGISFNRTDPNESGLVTPTNGDVIVSTWRYDPGKPLGMDYIRTVIVGKGTPSAFFQGRFNDKPSLRVDDWTSSPHEGNVYVAWTLFPAFGTGQDQVLFSRSTDGGKTFSKPIVVSKSVPNAQGADIAVAPDGTVYVVWRQFARPAAGLVDAMVFVKSTDGGKTFTDPQTIATIVGYDRSDQYVDGSFARDCGDGAFLCVSNFVFHRTDALPQAVADGAGTVFVTWEQLVPAADNGDTYHPDGQGQVVVASTSTGGASWSAPTPVSAGAVGHQWWPNIEYDQSTGTLAIVYYDSREDPSYSVNRPPGNVAGGTSVCGAPVGSATCNVLNTYIATSSDGVTWGSIKVSSVGHQPEYEMFGNRQIPFHGDYLWVDTVGGVIFGVWADNRDVVPGQDIRETTQDGFDVLQCRADAASADTCPNAGGLNANIYGAAL
jgi:hypothetical protein